MAGETRRPLVRAIVAAIAIAVCWGGAVVADIGFTDTARSEGIIGLFYWIPATFIGVIGIRQLHTQSRLARLGLYALALSVPALVLFRWIVALV